MPKQPREYKNYCGADRGGMPEFTTQRSVVTCRPARGQICSRSSFNPLIIPDPDPCPQLTLKTAMQPLRAA
ncbi:Hypothetical predicted protein [Cloeon dipterum]|uniref:Uncharacterized protein n=1 Tax=Cloeon dipterum TaxID=197152 RepID=A0A8S1CML5_9INSE|nr:Hypothetical predicted protein [Cloeon dipterum]